MRADGRKSDDLRKIEIIPHFEGLENVVFAKFGNTRVLAGVSVSDGVPPHLRNSGTGWLTSEYSLLPYSTTPRAFRERSKISGRTREIERLIGRSLRSIIDLSAIGEKTVFVDCDILYADGGTRCASITAGFVALAIYFRELLKKREIFTNPIKRTIAAVSCGIVEGEILLDLNYIEDNLASCDMNVIGDGEIFAEIQSSGEESVFSKEDFSKMLALASSGLKKIVELQKKVLSENL